MMMMWSYGQPLKQAGARCCSCMTEMSAHRSSSSTSCKSRPHTTTSCRWSRASDSSASCHVTAMTSPRWRHPPNDTATGSYGNKQIYASAHVQTAFRHVGLIWCEPSAETSWDNRCIWRRCAKWQIHPHPCLTYISRSQIVCTQNVQNARGLANCYYWL